MKKLITLLVFSLSIMFSYAQTNKSIVPIIGQTNDYIQLIENKYEQKVVHLEYDVIKTSKESYRQLFADVQYGIILFGDDNIKSLKLNISNIQSNNWTTVVSKESEKGIVMLYFKPTKTDFYRFDFSSILIKNDTYAYYGFLIFR
ncbi:MAG: hypothetical protein U9Q83_08070 [Bacteroidota bacterium]|nr:hypothetical protein [Bacteroidota bacterium]